MSKTTDEATVMVPASKEPDFPVNITSWRHYTCMRLLAAAILALSLMRFAETAWVTTARIDEVRAEAQALVERQSALGKYLDTAARFWFGRPPERVLVARKTGELVRRRRFWSFLGVAAAWLLTWAVFEGGRKGP
jgi:hypothetical protein